MEILKKIERIPYRFNRQTFNEDNSCIANLQLVTKKENYFRYLSDDERRQLRDSMEFNNELKNKVIAHAYWYGNIGRKQAFSILSYLATQDLTKTEVWLWLDKENGYEGYEKNIYLKEILPWIRVKRYDPLEELKDIWHLRTKIFTQQFNLPYRADAFRILVLYKYGGLYFDLDVCFLENVLQICGNGEWCYAWEKQAYANNALLYLENGKKSKLTSYLYWKAQVKAPMPWAILHYKDKNLKALTVYPYQLFDPAWLDEEAEATDEIFDTFFLPQDEIKSYKEFYPGALAYHWHNRWKMPECDNSYFSLFEREFKEILLGEKS